MCKSNQRQDQNFWVKDINRKRKNIDPILNNQMNVKLSTSTVSIIWRKTNWYLVPVLLVCIPPHLWEHTLAKRVLPSSYKGCVVSWRQDWSVKVEVVTYEETPPEGEFPKNSSNSVDRNERLPYMCVYLYMYIYIWPLKTPMIMMCAPF